MKIVTTRQMLVGTTESRPLCVLWLYPPCQERGAGGASAKGVAQRRITFIVSVPGSFIL